MPFMFTHYVLLSCDSDLVIIVTQTLKQKKNCFLTVSCFVSLLMVSFYERIKDAFL